MSLHAPAQYKAVRALSFPVVSGHGVQMFGAPAAVLRLTLHFDLSLSAPYRNGGYL